MQCNASLFYSSDFFLFFLKKIILLIDECVLYSEPTVVAQLIS